MASAFIYRGAKYGHQGFSLASAIEHSPKIVPDVQDFAVQFAGQFVRYDFRKHTLYGYAQRCNSKDKDKIKKPYLTSLIM